MGVERRRSRSTSPPLTSRAIERSSSTWTAIVADVPEHIHRQVRVKCLQRGVLVRDCILDLLARDGIK